MEALSELEQRLGISRLNLEEPYTINGGYCEMENLNSSVEEAEPNLDPDSEEVHQLMAAVQHIKNSTSSRRLKEMCSYLMYNLQLGEITKTHCNQCIEDINKCLKEEGC